MTTQFQRMWQEQQQFLSMEDRLSLSDCIGLVKMYLARMSEAEERLQHGYAMFHEREALKSGWCNEVIILIRTLYKVLDDFIAFMDQKSRLPLSILPLRYQLVTELVCMREQLWMALAKVGRFRSLQGELGEAALLRHDITCRLQDILKKSDLIVDKASNMFDCARFQEKRDFRS